jgi:hypothetical protein
MIYMILSNVFMQADTLRKKWGRGVDAKKLKICGASVKLHSECKF